MLTLRTGTRPSPLAAKQVEEIKAFLPGVRLEPVIISTGGDRDKKTPLSQTEGTDFFTRELEEALLKGEIDIAVHSAKDLEDDPPEGLTVAATTASISTQDCLVSGSGLTLAALPSGAVVGTSSRKRKEAILKFRPDLAVKDIRGNIDERLALVDSGKCDAVIVAHAALIRLGYQNRISQIIPDDIVQPHPLQGRIAVQVRSTRRDLIKMFKVLDGR